MISKKLLKNLEIRNFFYIFALSKRKSDLSFFIGVKETYSKCNFIGLDF